MKVVDVEYLAKLSSSVVDVELFLVSRNTLGNGKKQQTQILKGKCQMMVAEMYGGQA